MTSRNVAMKSYGLVLSGSDADQEQFTELLLKTAAREKYEFVINFATTDFERLVIKLRLPQDDIARIWAFTGMQTGRKNQSPPRLNGTPTIDENRSRLVITTQGVFKSFQPFKSFKPFQPSMAEPIA